MSETRSVYFLLFLAELRVFISQSCLSFHKRIKKKETTKSFLHFLDTFHVIYPEPSQITDKWKIRVRTDQPVR